MNSRISKPQRGMALVAGLLLLLVITILGVSMFRSFGLQTRIAGNTLEKQRALHNAEAAQAYAEWWLSSNSGKNATAGSACSTLVTTLTSTQVCSNQLTGNVATVPWKNTGGTAEIGFVYTPTGLTTQSPRFYIAFLSPFYDKASGTSVNTYRIDAAGWGARTDTISVVESTYRVSVSYTTLNKNFKFVSLTGP